MDEGPIERIDADGLSPELPVELLSKHFDQLATFGLAGCGLAITLAGSVLRDAPIFALVAAAEFGLAAMLTLSGQAILIQDLFESRAFRKRSRLTTGAAAVLIGMGIGTLAASVVLQGTPGPNNRVQQSLPPTAELPVVSVE